MAATVVRNAITTDRITGTEPRPIVTMTLATVGTIRLGPIRQTAQTLGVALLETKLGRGRHELVAVGEPDRVDDLARLVARYADDVDAAAPAPRPGPLRRILDRLRTTRGGD